jgi:hypothetical protein
MSFKYLANQDWEGVLPERNARRWCSLSESVALAVLGCKDSLPIAPSEAKNSKRCSDPMSLIALSVLSNQHLDRSSESHDRGRQITLWLKALDLVGNIRLGDGIRGHSTSVPGSSI